MPIYAYTAVDSRGKTKRGTLEARDTDQVRLQLKRSGLLAVRLREQGALTRDRSIPWLQRVRARELSLFCRQFVSIVGAGIPLPEALSLLAKQTGNQKLRRAIADLRIRVEEGVALSDAMRAHAPAVFPMLMIPMIAAGEASGRLELVLDRLALHFEREAKNSGALGKAMIYPSILLVSVISVVMVLLMNVIPSFETTFQDLQVQVPAVTAVVLALGHWMARTWWLVPVVLLGLVVGLLIWRRTPRGKRFFSSLALRIPLLGGWIEKRQCAVFAHTLGMLLASGLAMPEALQLTARALSNGEFAAAIVHCREELEAGGTLSEALQQEKRLFPAMVCHMVGIGEETGELPGLLERLAVYYDEEVQTSTELFLAAFEPVLIILLSILVGFLVSSVLIPLFSMYDALGKVG